MRTRGCVWIWRCSIAICPELRWIFLKPFPLKELQAVLAHCQEQAMQRRQVASTHRARSDTASLARTHAWRSPSRSTSQPDRKCRSLHWKVWRAVAPSRNPHGVTHSIDIRRTATLPSEGSLVRVAAARRARSSRCVVHRFPSPAADRAVPTCVADAPGQSWECLAQARSGRTRLAPARS